MRLRQKKYPPRLLLLRRAKPVRLQSRSRRPRRRKTDRSIAARRRRRIASTSHPGTDGMALRAQTGLSRRCLRPALRSRRSRSMRTSGAWRTCERSPRQYASFLRMRMRLVLPAVHKRVETAEARNKSKNEFGEFPESRTVANRYLLGQTTLRIGTGWNWARGTLGAVFSSNSANGSSACCLNLGFFGISFNSRLTTTDLNTC